VVALTLVAVTVVPGQHRRDRITRFAARNVFRLAGVRITIKGWHRLPTENCVVVANHVSYVDGPLMKGVLPAPYSFVIKGEMRNIPGVHFFLRRGGARFVERHEASGSARDARAIVKAASGGQPLGVFPEGTFREELGVGRFRAGAFVAATRAGLPIVPAAITGTRHILPANRILPRPGPITVEILEPIMPDDDAYGDSRKVAEIARQRVIAAVGEPDLLA
jgi:1-acyl-sn-glycerol-3-phosphate acyltransferase